jgi:hypothetical protein
MDVLQAAVVLWSLESEAPRSTAQVACHHEEEHSLAECWQKAIGNQQLAVDLALYEAAAESDQLHMGSAQAVSKVAEDSQGMGMEV